MFELDGNTWSEVDELFDAALDRPASERERWLEGACPDAKLRARVLELLRASASTDTIHPSGAMTGPLWDEVAEELERGRERVGLEEGARIGNFEVVELIGSGGMGHVYRAIDPGLQRHVAIKALFGDFARDTSNLRRFEREARLLASLNHPNIAAIYDFLQFEGRPYLVLELVEGETLHERIRRQGALEIKNVILIATQLAEALEEAHRKGVVHRDLKPGNVKFKDPAHIKVLDFGLAKSRDQTQQPGGATTTTQSGMVLGTPGYMSPEQARGMSVDERSDIWAFGCLLYEMVTGERAHGGRTASEATASVLRDEVNWQRLPAATPPGLRRLMARCLRKEPHDRLQDIGDARIELTEMASGAHDAESLLAMGEQGSRPGGWKWPALAAAFLAGALASALVAFGPNPVDGLLDQSIIRTTIPVGPRERLFTGATRSLAISRDGSRVAFVGESESRIQLFVRELSSYEPTMIRNSDGARDPFFSPDGEWIGFFAQGEMRRVPVSGGLAETITSEVGLQPRGASWAENGRIVFAQDSAPGLYSVDAVGGEPSVLSEPDASAGTRQYRWPQWLPGGEQVLLTERVVTAAGIDENLAILDARTGEVTSLRRGAQGSYVDSGHIVYASAGTLEAVPFDGSARKLAGPSTSVLEGVQSYPGGATGFAVSRSGTLLYLNPVRSITLDWIHRDGATTPVDAHSGTPGWPRISTDGRWAAIHVGAPESRDLWSLDLERPGSIRQLTFKGGGFPTWSSDGSLVAFMSRRDGPGNLYTIAADGSGEARVLLEGDRTKIPVSWSSKGVLAYYEIAETTQRDIWVLDTTSGTEPTPFVATPANELSPVFSPDGKWVAYVSNETGRNEVYIRPYPPPGPVTAVSIEGGTEPVWRPDGRALYYRHGDAIMTVPVRATSRIELDRPSVVVESNMVPNASGNASYAVPDSEGQRFLMLQRAPGASVDYLQLIVHWDAELNEHVPQDP